jgi:hypothetical protein
MAKIFLSHSTEDKPWLIGLVHKLKWLGHAVFIDEPRGVDLPLEQGIPIGQSWYEVLERELKAVDYVLAVWSPAAAAKMATGGGEAFSREIFWAARNRKLLFACIEQNESPTEESDAAFYASMQPIDTAALSAMLAKDEIYGNDRVVAKELGAQHFRIEGLRLGKQQMVGRCDGVGRLQREVLAPDESQKAKPEKRHIELPRQYLDMARDAIDRSSCEPQLRPQDRSRQARGRARRWHSMEDRLRRRGSPETPRRSPEEAAGRSDPGSGRWRHGQSDRGLHNHCGRQGRRAQLGSRQGTGG